MLELIFYVLYLAFTIFLSLLLIIKTAILLQSNDTRIILTDVIIILIISLLWSNWYIVM